MSGGKVISSGVNVMLGTVEVVVQWAHTKQTYDPSCGLIEIEEGQKRPRLQDSAPPVETPQVPVSPKVQALDGVTPSGPDSALAPTARTPPVVQLLQKAPHGATVPRPPAPDEVLGQDPKAPWFGCATISKVLLTIVVLLIVTLAFNSLVLSRSSDDFKHHSVRLCVQRTEDGYKLPMGESPRSLRNFLNDESQTTYLLEPSVAGPAVYATIAETNRLDLIIKKDQVESCHRSAGGLAAFIVIRISPLESCVDGKETQRVAKYIRETFNVTSIAFVCYWNPRDNPTEGFAATPFTQQSLKNVDKTLRRPVSGPCKWCPVLYSSSSAHQWQQTLLN